MRRYLTILVLIASFVLATGMAKAVDPVLFFVVGQLINDKRQEPVERNVISLNPIYNTMYNGNFVGSCPDPRTIVAANGRGTTLLFEPGQMGRKDILGFELLSNSPYLPEKIAAYHEVLTEKKSVKVRTATGTTKETQIVSEKVDLTIGQNQIVKGNPKYAKWQLPISTLMMPQGLYQIKIRVWFLESKTSGIFKTDRKDVIQREETLCRFIVCDPGYMQQAVNSPEIQASLRASFGLMGGPPQVGGLNLAVSDEMEKNLPPPPSPVRPATQPSQAIQPEGAVRPETISSPKPQPEMVRVMLVFWKDKDRQLWRNQVVPKNYFQAGQIVEFQRDGKLIGAAEISQNDDSSGIIEFYIFRGEYPCQGDRIVRGE